MKVWLTQALAVLLLAVTGSGSGSGSPDAARQGAPLGAKLSPAASSGPCTVLEIDQSSVPADTTWFRLRGATADMPPPMAGVDSPGGEWFRRTAAKPAGESPQGIQQHPFMGTGVFNAGNVREIVPCNLSAPRTAQAFVVEAWSDRNDLSDGGAAKLLASSTPLTFTFDDQGFSKALKFQDFAAAGSTLVPGMVTVTAQPSNATAMAMAKLVSWYGFTPLPAAASEDNTALPKFGLATAFLGDQYTTREFSPEAKR